MSKKKLWGGTGLQVEGGIPRCHPASPDYGTHQENFVNGLTLENWEEKALVRRAAGCVAIVYIQPTLSVGKGGTRRTLRVEVVGGQELERDFGEDQIEAALAYANGLGEPADRSEWPPEEEAPWIILMGGLQR